MFGMPGSRARPRPMGRAPLIGLNAAVSPNWVVQPWANQMAIGIGGVFGTISVGPVAAYPPNFWVAITNQSASRGKLVTAVNGGTIVGGSFILWPQQTCYLYAKNAGSWVATRPSRFNNTGALTVFVDPTGSDTNNDGLGTGTGAMQTITGAFNLIQQNFQPNAGAQPIQLANATYTSSDTFLGGTTGGFLLQLGGAAGQGANVIYQGLAFNKDYVALQYHDMTFNTGAGSCIRCGQSGVVDILSGVTFGAASGAAHLEAMNGGVLNLSNSYTASGGAVGFHLYAHDGGQIAAGNGVTLTVSGNVSATDFAISQINGLINVGGLTISGAGVAGSTGARYSASLGGGIWTNGGGANYFPGNSAGSATSPGWYG